jgi:hypothetical protein
MVQNRPERPDCTVAIEFPACFSMGSSFSATFVKPKARKRLEERPEVICLNEFMAETIAETRCKTDFENSLFWGEAFFAAS